MKDQTTFINNKKDSVQLVIKAELTSVRSRLFAPLSDQSEGKRSFYRVMTVPKRTGAQQ